MRLKLVSAAVMSCFASAALANPVNPSVAHGSVSITGLGTSSVSVTNTGGTNAIINWQGFSIGATELTQFSQFLNLAVLNRVTGTDVSSILGQLRSDGRLFLINPNGIVIGAGALLDLPGFVASSLSLSDADFLAGRMNFQAVPGAGSVENHASIFPHPGGSVYLVGPAVTNGGVISTSQGEVVLAAGNSVELVNTGTPGLSVVMSAPGNQVLNLGQLSASNGGRVGIFGGLVTQQGFVSAGNAVVDPSGSVRLVATEATVLAAGSTTTGGSVAIDTGALTVEGAVTSGPQAIRAAGGVAVRNGLLTAEGGQTIDAQFLEIESTPGTPFGVPVGVVNIGGDQRISLTGANATGEGLVVRNAGGGVATIQGGPGGQLIEVARALTVQGGSTTAQILGTGDQSISAESILLQGGAAGNGGSALIVSSNGSQTINAGAGGISLIGGSSPGTNNLVTINQASSNLALTQVINSQGPVLVQGGSNGTGNSAAIRAGGGLQTIVAGDTTLIAGTGGTNNFSAVQGRSQDITVHGHLAIIGGSSAGTPTVGGGARIGGLGGTTATGTDLRLNVDGDMTMAAGSVSGVLLGNSPVSSSSNTVVAANVSGDIVMDGGAGPSTFATIGARSGTMAGGNITLTAGGDLTMNSTAPDRASIIRTTDAVSLTAQNITQGPDSRIEAGSLTFSSQTGARLSGTNSVGTLSGSNWFNDVVFRNASSLLTVSGLDVAGSTLDLDQTGDLRISGLVISGQQDVSATGHLSVVADAVSAGTLSAFGGQSISARSMDVTAQDGASAFVSNNGFGDQTIAIAGGGASSGLDVRTLSGAGFAVISNNVAGATQNIQVTDADHIAINGMGSGGASIQAVPGNQAISITGSGANAMNFGSAGALGFSQIAADHQTVTAGLPGQSGSITIVGSDGSSRLAGMVSQPGIANSQSVGTSGALTIVGGSAAAQSPNFPAGIFHNGTGQQTISAQSILLQGGATGSGNSAIIGGNNGSQSISAGPGGITLRGGATGMNNFAMINQVSTNPAFTQSVLSTGPVLLEGGSGNFNFAMIRAFGGHQGLELGSTTLLAGATGIDNFSVIQARSQHMTVHGGLTLQARASSFGTAGGGSRIGGLGGAAPTGTDLRLNVDGNLTMTGGDLSGTGVILGNTTNVFGDTDITVRVGGDMSMNGGSVPDTFAVIGSRSTSMGGGAIDITANGHLALNSTAPDRASIVRTQDDVRLTARQITQGPDARIEAGSLSVNTQEGALLAGANAVGQFNAMNHWFGDITLHNTSSQLTVTGVQNFAGGLTLQQTGNLLVSGLVFTGVQDVDVSGGLIVRNEPFAFAQLSATGGQSIDAGYIEVNGSVGDGMLGGASIANFGGEQRIATSGANAAGESLALRGSNGASAAILSGGGLQSILLTGPGPNALVMESADAMFGTGTGISGDRQMIVAGNPGENGSITLRGPISQISSSPMPGGSQTVMTSGTLTLAGSATDFSFGPAGIFANSPDGQQTVRAESIRLQGGDGGNGAVIVAIGGSQLVEAGAGGISLTGAAAPGNGGATISQQSADLALSQTVRSGGAILLQGGSLGGGNSAVIAANGGSQTIEAGAGGITLRGGETGGNNFAMINQVSTNQAATQTVTSTGPVWLEGGSGNFNFAMIRGFGGLQTLEFGDTTLLAGATGIDNFSVIQARSQDMTVHGGLTLQARASSFGTAGGGSRIGGLGGAAPTGTDLRLNVDGNLTMTGGDLSGTGVILGNTTNVFGDTDITVRVGGDMSMNGGSVPDTFAVIGQRGGGSAGGGDIEVVANGAIAMNSTSPEQASIIRTTDAVSLTAQSIAQGPDARIETGSLTVATAQGASLGGANSVSQLAMLNADSGAIDFNNTSLLLTVTGIDQVKHGALNLTQTGDLRIAGDVVSGMQAISATGDMTVTASDGPGVTVQAYGPQTFDVGGSFSLLGGTALGGYAQTLAAGPVRITTGGDLTVQGGSGLLAYALLYGDESIRLTVGDELHVNGGSGLLAFARVQTGLWDKIYLTFPNRSSGGYFVDGREGATHHGLLDGFFTGLLPARRGRSLIVSYGE